MARPKKKKKKKELALEWEFGISRGKLLYIEWINNKVILYKTGNYIQYSVTNHNGKEYGKEYEKEYVYV